MAAIDGLSPPESDCEREWLFERKKERMPMPHKGESVRQFKLTNSTRRRERESEKAGAMRSLLRRHRKRPSRRMLERETLNNNKNVKKTQQEKVRNKLTN